MPTVDGADTEAILHRGKPVWRVVRLVIVFAMLIGLVYVAKPGELWRALKGAEWFWLLAGVPFGFAAIFFDALKLYLLILPHGYRGGWGSVFRTTLIVNFVSLFLPGTVGGGAVAWYRLSKPDGLRAQAFTAVSFNALIKLVVICGVGAAALSVDVLAADLRRQIALPLYGLAVVTGLAFLLLTMTGLSGWVNRVVVAKIATFLPSVLANPLTKIAASVETYRGFKASVIGALGAGVGRKLIENFCFLLALKAVGVDAGYARVLWVMCAVEAFGMIPLTLSGWGLPQVTFVSLFALFGVPSDLSLASQLLSVVVLLPVYLTGAFLLLGETLASRKSEKEGALPSPEPEKKRPCWIWDAVCLAIILAAFILAGLDYLNRPGELSPLDTAGYLENARLIRESGGPIGWLAACFTGKYPTVNQMPLYLIILSGFSFQTVNVLAWAKLITLCIGATGVLATYLIARELFGRAEAVFASAALAVNTAWLQHSSMVACESLLAIFVTLTWFYLVLYWRDRKFGAQIGASAALALLSKATAVLLLPVMAGVALAKERLKLYRSWQFWFGVLACVLVCLPLLVRNTLRFRSPFYSVTSAGKVVMVDDWSEAWTQEQKAPPGLAGYLRTHSVKQMATRLGKGATQEGIYFVVATGQTYLFNERLGRKAWPVGLLMLLLAAASLLKKEDRAASWIAAAIGAIFFLFFSWFLIKDIRFIVPLIPIILLLAARGARTLMEKYGRLLHARAPGHALIAVGLLIALGSGIAALAQPNVPGEPTRVQHLPPGYIELHDWMQRQFGPETVWMIGLGQEYRYFWGDPLPGRMLPVPGASFDHLLDVIEKEKVRYIILDYSTISGMPNTFGGRFEVLDNTLIPLNPPSNWVPLYQYPGPGPAYIIYSIPNH
jgi:uncharacterized protein (TIRG00374 family)